VKTSHFLMVVAIAMVIFSSCENDLANEETLATVQTLAISDVTTVSAVVTGVITSNGNSEITSKGFCWSVSAEPTINNSLAIVDGNDEEFQGSIKLDPNKTYYVRAFATNLVGVAYGKVLEINSGSSPVIEPISVVVTDKSALIKVKINNNNSATTVTVEYGTDYNYGKTINVNTVINEPAIISVDIFELNYDSKYFYRIKAENSNGVKVYASGSFTTTLPVMTDVDGNVYKSVQIGDQIWIAENLKVTHYNDGTPIPHIMGKEMEKTFKGAYCCYNDSPDTAKVYGLLYNWYAIEKLAPKGWHVPTEAEWRKLSNFVNVNYETGYGNQLKEAGENHWKTPNYGNNSTGFTALPGGSVGYNMGYTWCFADLHLCAIWWCGDQKNAELAAIMYMDWNNPDLMTGYILKKIEGLSIRLIKD
jgi:uncharacterized protein (TIGR02145 family)